MCGKWLAVKGLIIIDTTWSKDAFFQIINYETKNLSVFISKIINDLGINVDIKIIEKEIIISINATFARMFQRNYLEINKNYEE